MRICPPCTQFGRDRPNPRIGPQNIIQNVQRQCFWCIAAKLTWRRLSVAAYGCALLLLVTFALDELAVS